MSKWSLPDDATVRFPSSSDLLSAAARREEPGTVSKEPPKQELYRHILDLGNISQLRSDFEKYLQATYIRRVVKIVRSLHRRRRRPVGSSSAKSAPVR